MQAIKVLPVILISLLLVGGFLLVAQTNAATVTSIIVDTLDDELNDDEDCSLREAITAANSNAMVDDCPAGSSTVIDIITFSVTGTITLASDSLPDILATGGPLVIEGGNVITINGDNKYKILIIQSGAELSLQNLQIINGTTEQHGGAFSNHGNLTISGSTLTGNGIFTTTLSYNLGGAIYNTGILTITNSALTENYITGVQSGYGGALYNAIGSQVYISTSTIDSNTVSVSGQGFGGGSVNAGELIINSSSIYSNSIASQSIESYGGGIYNTKGSLEISNSTISHNTGGVGLYNETDGLVEIAFSTFADNDDWGIDNSKFITITGSIVTDMCTGSPITDGGDNLEEGDTCGFSSGANTDPLLAPLGDYGGETFTHALMPDSPAIDAVNTVSCVDTDQRGVSRPVDGDEDGSARCDIGAFEYQPGIDFLPTKATITNDMPDPSYVNQPFTVTTTISSSIGTPTGTVSVTVSDDDASCASSLVAGTSSCQLLLTGPGTYTLEATYGGDSTFAASTSSAEHAAIKAPSTTTILSDLPDPSMVDETIVVSFEVTSTFGIPAGKVSVYVIDTSETCSNKLVNGAGSCELSISKPGLHTLTAAYNGNAAMNPSSDTEEHTVDQPEPPPSPFQLLFLPHVLSDN